MSIERPSPTHPRVHLARFITFARRQRGVRWIAAAGAAVLTLVTLDQRTHADEALGSTVSSAPPGEASRLPAGTRGVSLPMPDSVSMGDAVDVYAARTASLVASEAVVIDVSGNEALVAIDTERVPDAIDALTSGGVIVVLAASAP